MFFITSSQAQTKQLKRPKNTVGISRVDNFVGNSFDIYNNVYNISGDRLQTDGKGQSESVSDNTSTDGKAQNRRVEFIKI